MDHEDFIFTVHVHPGARHAAVGGSHDGRLVVRVLARAVGGAANEAVLASLAGALGVARDHITFAHATRSRDKLVRVSDVIDQRELRQRHAELLRGSTQSPRGGKARPK